MVEIHHIEKTDYKRIGSKSFRDEFNEGINNSEMKRVWSALSDVSRGTLQPEFEQLYWFGGAWSPAYDIEGKLGNVPPSATIQTSDKNLELLLPVYKSTLHRNRIRPAVLGVWAHQDQQDIAQVFMRNLDSFSTQLRTGDVYAIMRRPDKTLLASRYDSPQNFRADYFNAIHGEQGQVLVVTNDPDYALRCYQKEETEGELDRISTGEAHASFMVRRLPRFVSRVFVGNRVAHEYSTIEDALK